MTSPAVLGMEPRMGEAREGELIQFVVPGQPVAKARARTFAHKQSGRIVSMTPERTRKYEVEVRRAFFAAYPGFKPFGPRVPVMCHVHAMFKAPAKLPPEMLARPICSQYSDWDNIGKIVSDSLNGIAWADDRQIADGQTLKYYSRDPRVIVEIRRLG